MEKFIKENWFKIAILSLGLLIMISVTYYFIGFLPQKDIAEKSQRCSETGKKFFNDYKKPYDNDPDASNIEWESPEFHFNNKLNSCLVYIGFTINDYFPKSFYVESYPNNEIFDVYSNKKLLQSNVIIFNSLFNGDVGEYISDSFNIEELRNRTLEKKEKIEVRMSELNGMTNLFRKDFFEKKQLFLSE